MGIALTWCCPASSFPTKPTKPIPTFENRTPDSVELPGVCSRILPSHTQLGTMTVLS